MNRIRPHVNWRGSLPIHWATNSNTNHFHRDIQIDLMFRRLMLANQIRFISQRKWIIMGNKTSESNARRLLIIIHLYLFILFENYFDNENFVSISILSRKDNKSSLMHWSKTGEEEEVINRIFNPTFCQYIRELNKKKKIEK